MEVRNISVSCALLCLKFDLILSNELISCVQIPYYIS